jgi:predicted dehydrogenase
MRQPLAAGTAPVAPCCPPFSATAARTRNRHGGAPAAALWDHGPHMMSLFLPVLGPAEEVTAVQGQHETSHVLVRHAGGAVSALAVSLTVPKASIGLDVAFLGDNGVTHLPVADAEPVPALARAAGELVRAAVRRSEGHVCDVRFGWEINAVLTAAAESIATGRGVAVRHLQSLTW